MSACKIGISAGAYKGITIEETMPYLRNAGFDATFTGYRDLAQVSRFAELFAANGIFYESIHAPWDNINQIWLDGEEGARVLARFCECVESCAAIGVPIAVVHLSSGENPPPVTDCGRGRWETLIETAEKNNIVLAFENQRKLSNLAYIFETYPHHPNVAFCWDCGHESCFTPGRSYMPLFGKKLVCTHLHDNFGLPDRQTPDVHILPFDGNMDYQYVADMLDRDNYRGTLMLEVSSRHETYANMTAEDYYLRAAAALRRLESLRRPQA